jgi:hypothetical protein
MKRTARNDVDAVRARAAASRAALWAAMRRVTPLHAAVATVAGVWFAGWQLFRLHASHVRMLREADSIDRRLNQIGGSISDIAGTLRRTRDEANVRRSIVAERCACRTSGAAALSHDDDNCV